MRNAGSLEICIPAYLIYHSWHQMSLLRPDVIFTIFNSNLKYKVKWFLLFFQNAIEYSILNMTLPGWCPLQTLENTSICNILSAGRSPVESMLCSADNFSYLAVNWTVGYAAQTLSRRYLCGTSALHSHFSPGFVGHVFASPEFARCLVPTWFLFRSSCRSWAPLDGRSYDSLVIVYRRGSPSLACSLGRWRPVCVDRGDQD